MGSNFIGIHFARFSLGQGVPSFGPIEVRRHSENQAVVEVEIRYASAVDVTLKATAGASLSLGVKRLDFFGRLCLELKPLLDTWPVVGACGASHLITSYQGVPQGGAVIVYFAAQPKLQLQFCGIVDAPLPGLAKRVQSAVEPWKPAPSCSAEDWLFSTLVLPKFKCLEITSDERLLSLAACTREPIGVLKVHVCRGVNLAGANWKMGAVRHFTSNPYCVLRLAGTSVRSSTVRNSTNPDWPDTDVAYFIVHNKEQELQVDVMDNDEGFLQRNFVGLLGRLRVSVTQLLSGGIEQLRRYKLDTSEVKSGLLHVDDPVNTGIPSEARGEEIDVKFKWLDFSPSPAPPLSGQQDPQGVVLVELHQGTGFPEEAALKGGGLRWKCWIEEDQAVYSSNGKAPEHPATGLASPAGTGWWMGCTAKLAGQSISPLPHFFWNPASGSSCLGGLQGEHKICPKGGSSMSCASNGSDLVAFNVGGKIYQVLREPTLSLHPNSLLTQMAEGQKDDKPIFVGGNQELFQYVIDYRDRTVILPITVAIDAVLHEAFRLGAHDGSDCARWSRQTPSVQKVATWEKANGKRKAADDSLRILMAEAPRKMQEAKGGGFRDFETSLPDCLHHCIDQLTARGVSPATVAEIVEVDAGQVVQYLAAKSQHAESEAQRKQDFGEVQCVELSWYETLAVNDPEASICLSLVTGRGESMGALAEVKDVIAGALGGKWQVAGAIELERVAWFGWFVGWTSDGIPKKMPHREVDTRHMQLAFRLLDCSSTKGLTHTQKPPEPEGHQKFVALAFRFHSSAEKNGHEISRQLVLLAWPRLPIGALQRLSNLSAWIFPACAPVPKDRFRAAAGLRYGEDWGSGRCSSNTRKTKFFAYSICGNQEGSMESRRTSKRYFRHVVCLGIAMASMGRVFSLPYDFFAPSSSKHCASNRFLDEDLKMYRESGRYFIEIYCYKTHLPTSLHFLSRLNRFLRKIPFCKTLFPRLLRSAQRLEQDAHHQGVVLAHAVNGFKPRYLKIDFCNSGLAYSTTADFPEIQHQISWSEAEGRFRKARINPANGDIEQLIKLLGSIGDRPYHARGWNCQNVTDEIWRCFVTVEKQESPNRKHRPKVSFQDRKDLRGEGFHMFINNGTVGANKQTTPEAKAMTLAAGGFLSTLAPLALPIMATSAWAPLFLVGGVASAIEELQATRRNGSDRNISRSPPPAAAL
eukprot:Skav205080  [mRNA]  locus=scaffold142:524896:536954:- [translate_table: standard]